MADLPPGVGPIVPRAASTVAARVPPSSLQTRAVGHLALVATLVTLVVAWDLVSAWPRQSAVAPMGAVLGLVSSSCALLLCLRRLPLQVKLGLGAAYWVFLGAVLPDVTPALGWEWMNSTRWLDVLLLTFPLVVPLPPIAAGVVLVILSGRDAWSLLIAAGFGSAPGLSSSDAAAQLVSGIPWFSAGLGVLVYAAHYTTWRSLSAWQTWGSLLPRRQLSTGEGGSTWELYPGRLKQRAVVQLSPPTARFDDEAYDGFETEMRRLTTLRSPHIASVYEFGMSQTGATYCVREHADGLTWQQLVLEHGALMPERAITLLVQVCSALIEALEGGITHGALTADNLLVTRNRQEYDVVKVLNFGLWAWLPLERVSGEGSGFRFRGNPEYLAPELIATGERSSTADVYALGCLGLLLLTGRCPFVGETSAVLSQHLHTEAPTVTSLAAMRPPKDLEQIVLDCLRKDPALRPDVQTIRRRLRACGAATHWHQGRAKAWWLANVPEPEPEPVSKRGRVTRRALFRGRLR